MEHGSDLWKIIKILERGTRVGVERSLCASEPGGTCSSLSLVPSPVLPLHSVLRTAAPFFSPARRTQKFAKQDRQMVPSCSTLISSLRVGSRPPVATSPRTPNPPFFDREALRAPAHSLRCSSNPSFPSSFLSSFPSITFSTASYSTASPSLNIMLTVTSVPSRATRPALSFAMRRRTGSSPGLCPQGNDARRLMMLMGPLEAAE
jgi:hypothetical protein